MWPRHQVFFFFFFYTSLLPNSCLLGVACYDTQVRSSTAHYERTHSACLCLPVTWKQTCTINICCAALATPTPTNFKHKQIIDCMSWGENKPLKQVCKHRWNVVCLNLCLRNSSLLFVNAGNVLFLLLLFFFCYLVEMASNNVNQLFPSFSHFSHRSYKSSSLCPHWINAERSHSAI